MTACARTYTVEEPETRSLIRFARRHPFPLLYASVHGSRLYGFDVPDSDWDLRGCHVLPTRQVLGLQEGPDTITRKAESEETGVELVTHEVRKLFRLLLKGNGNILEEALSPLVLVTGEFHDELKEIAGQCISKAHAGHYLGMARQARSVLDKPGRQEVKYALHTYRALLTGIHLMETGELECNLRHLNREARLSHVEELLERRRANPEDQHLTETEAGLMASEFDRLVLRLKEAADRSARPAKPRVGPQLDDLLVRVRRGGLSSDIP